MTNEDYAEWLEQRRSVASNNALTDRIMSNLQESAPGSVSPPQMAPRAKLISRIGPGLLLTGASLLFAAKIAALVGNLVFPTESFPEFANEIKAEEPDNAHGNVSRS